ncbi:unnamed protein product [Vicia faba]|uniref:Uncharacterized protein n=1 Tax=Vicia faba TaxID=3906 RepID=A0AAV0YCX0_VICFA|nr:unnamed protein product [Vicia faba]
MSRCLPFPPPNYMKNGIGGEALLQQLEFRRVKYTKEKKEEKERKRSHNDEKSKENDKKSKRSHVDKKSEEDDKKSEKNHEEKRSNDDKKSEDDDKKSKRINDDKESEKDDNSKSSHEKKKEQKHDVEKMETHLVYTKLTMNWVPLRMQMVPTDLQNENWLSRKNHFNGESESKTADRTEHFGNSNCTDNGSYQRIQPLASYLPLAEVYALPYALPF